MPRTIRIGFPSFFATQRFCEAYVRWLLGRQETCMPKEPAERRSVPRHCAVLDGQVTDLLMQSKMTVRCSDIAVNGCYLDTLNPLEAGTPVLVRLEYGGCAVELRGKVAYRVPRLGMGVQFARPVPTEQFATLQAWLEELAKASHEEACRPN